MKFAQTTTTSLELMTSTKKTLGVFGMLNGWFSSIDVFFAPTTTTIFSSS